MKWKKFAVLMLATVLLGSAGNFWISLSEVKAELDTYIPIKWAVIVMGGYNYYRDLTLNAIQRSEKIMQGRGVPYDLIPDVDIVAPIDDPPPGKYSLQYANGSLRYQAIILILDWWNNPIGVNQDYIYWAVDNGTNAVIFDRVAQVVPNLLNITFADVGFVWALKDTVCTVNKTFNDEIKEYPAGSTITIGASLQWHAIIHKYAKMTFWFNKTWDTDWSLGMANTTYGNGKVWYLGWCWNDAFRMDDATCKYVTTWAIWHFDFWGHAINFALNSVEKISVKILPYKKWKGAWIIRFDTDHCKWEDYWLPPESVLKTGWIWDYQYSVLGFGRSGGTNDLELTNGAPEGYIGIPSLKVMHTDVTGVLEVGLVGGLNFKAIVYNSTVGGGYDRIKLDFNGNNNFSDDTEYRLWENMTYPSVQGKLYWCSITPNATQPEKINIGWWQTPMLFTNESVPEKYRQYGHDYGLSYSFHGWQHTAVPAPGGGTYGMWNGTSFTQNATYIEEHFDAARYWMSYSFDPTGYGFEENEVIVSHPGDCHPDPVDSVIANLTWVLFSYPGQQYFYGFGRESPADKYWLSCSRTEDFWDRSNFTAIQEIVQTLYPVISTFTHALDENIFNACKSFSFPPYSNSIKPANPREAFQFWINAKYMLEHTVNAYYKNGKVVLEFTANNTLQDYVWKFPIEYDGNYFNGFSDSRSIGKIKYVYIEFSQGQGSQRLEVNYGSNPHIHDISNHIENVTQTYTIKNLTLQLWNASGSINVRVNCARLGHPSSVKIGGETTKYEYNPTTNICSFNLTFNGSEIIQLLWTYAPPNAPMLTSPLAARRFDPNKRITFAWVFNDSDTGDFQCAYRFQLASNNQFASPIIDTGKITSNSAYVTQTLPNKVGLYYWHVKTWDNHDAEGDWSVDQSIIVDKLNITLKDTTDNRTDVGAPVDVYFNITREYDAALFDRTKGTAYINGSLATWDEMNKYWKLSVTQGSVGKCFYQVSSITDTEYGITAISDSVGSQQVIWDKVLVTITPDTTKVTVGMQVNFTVTAVYAYDNKRVPSYIVDISRDKMHFAINNYTDTSAIASTHLYAAEKVTETIYGLNAFTSNSPTVTWTEKTMIQLLVEWITSNALVIVPSVELIVVLIFLLTRERKAKR